MMVLTELLTNGTQTASFCIVALITIRRRDGYCSYSKHKTSIIFQMLFCVGNFFGDDNKEWDALKSGEIKGEKFIQ